MARLTEVVLTCDVHDGESYAVETVTFTVEGRSYECELCDDHQAEFREATEVWSSHARQAGPGRSGRSGGRGRGGGRGASTAEVREWAGPRGWRSAAVVASRPNCGPPTRPPMEHAEVTRPKGLHRLPLRPQAGAAPRSSAPGW